jgi:hypothetical protein
MEPGTVVSFCDRTGKMVRPWREAGYRAITVDLQSAAMELLPGLRHHVIADVRAVGADAIRRKAVTPIVAVFAFPPCTNLAVSGARWFQSKGLGGLIEGLEIVNACRELCEALGAPWMLENPVSTLATYWRKPDHIFHPWQFTGLEPADNYTKKTCLWTGGGFVMPEPCPAADLSEPDNRIHFASPGDDRSDFRSATPMGFARAVFQANTRAFAVAAE